MTNIVLILTIVGSVGLFIYGMKVMSEAIQRIAGKAMRNKVNRLTSSPAAGILTGLFTTALIQSSSAATVMIVSFANAGIFKLRQSITLIMGANIGTTLTGWLFLVFGFSKLGVQSYLWLLLALATPLYFFKKSGIKNTGYALIGFSIMFIGLTNLKLVFQNFQLQENDALLQLLNQLGSIGFGSIIIFILLGTVLSIIAQSSTVALGFTLALCAGGLPLELGAAMVLGENIGTTSTANIAAIVANVHGKRAARAHTFFNLLMAVWFLFAFFPLVQLIASFVSFFRVDPNLTVPFSLALIHTLVNIINTLVLVWFIPKFEQMVIHFTPSKSNKDEEFGTEFFEHGITSVAPMYEIEVKRQLSRFALNIKKLVEAIQHTLTHPDPDATHRDIAIKFELLSRKVKADTAEYVVKISQNQLSENMASKLRIMLSVAGELERLSHVLEKIPGLLEYKKAHTIWFEPKQRSEIKALLGGLERGLEILYRGLNSSLLSTDLDAIKNITHVSEQTYKRVKKEIYNHEFRKDYPQKSIVLYYDLVSLCKEASILVQTCAKNLE